MENSKQNWFTKLFDNKKFFHYFIIMAGIITLIIILTMLQARNIITSPEKEAIEEVAVDMVEIKMKYVDGQYIVDKATKKYYIDIT